MPKAKSKLKNVVLDEVSFVNAGDNPEAHITLVKMKPGAVEEITSVKKDFDGDRVALLKQWAGKRPNIIKGMAVSFFDILQNQQIRDMIWDMVWALEDSISSIMQDDSVSSKGEAISQSVSEFQEAITTITKGEQTMPKELEKKLEDAQGQVDALTKEKETLEAQIKTLTEGNEALTAEVAKLKEAAGETEETTIDKSKLPESVRKHLEETEAKLEKQAKDIEKMQDENLTVAMVSKAAEVPHVGSADEVSKVLKTISKVNTALCDTVFDMLKKADARIRESGLVSESGADTNPIASNAVEKVKAKAAELKKSNPALTDEQAFAQVFKSDRELRAEYMREQESK